MANRPAKVRGLSVMYVRGVQGHDHDEASDRLSTVLAPPPEDAYRHVLERRGVALQDEECGIGLPLTWVEKLPVWPVSIFLVKHFCSSLVE